MRGDGFLALILASYALDLVDSAARPALSYFFQVVGGKITTYETQFDATELRKLLAAKKG